MTEIDSLLFKIDINKQSPCQGSLLISEPFLREDYFCHSVICLVDYDPNKNTMGIVLNKPTPYSLGSLVKQLKNNLYTPVYCGGPLSCDRLYYIHSLGDIIPDSRKIVDDLFIGGDFNTVIDYVNSTHNINNKIRFFIGYSGWDSGQLEEELQHNVWAVSKIADTNNLFNGAGDKYWHNHVKEMGDEFRGWLYHPENPQMN